MEEIKFNLPEVSDLTAEINEKPVSFEDIEEILETGNYEDFKESLEDPPQENPEIPAENSESQEEEEEEEVVEQFIEEEDIANLAEYLYKEGSIITPEDFDGEVDRKVLKDLIDIRVEREKETVRNETMELTQKAILNKFSPIVQQVVSYQLDNPNHDDEDILEYVSSLQGVNRINSLNPETHADIIVREYYKAKQLPSDEIEDMINSLLSSDKLQSKAEKLKPELDKIAKEVVSKKTEKERLIREYDEKLQDSLRTDTVNILNKGKLHGIELSDADSQYLYSVIMNNDVPVTIKGNKKVEMGYLEALVMQAKYDPKGNKENLMMAALVLRDGLEGVKKYLKREAANEEVEEIQRNIKFKNRKRTNTRVKTPNEKHSGVHLTF